VLTGKTAPAAVNFLRMLADFMTVFAAFAVGLAAYRTLGVGKHDPRIMPYVYLALFAGFVFAGVFRWMGLYAQGRSSLSIAEVQRLFGGYAAGSLILVAATFFSRLGQDDPPSRLVLLYALVLIFPALRFQRFILQGAFDWLHRRLGGEQRALIVGRGEMADQLARTLERVSTPLYRVSRVPDDAVGNMQHVAEAVQRGGIDAVFVVEAGLSHASMLELQKLCEEAGAQFSYVPDLFELVTHDIRMTEVDGVPLIVRRTRGRRWLYLACKRLFDAAFASVALVVLSPAMLAIALAVKFDSPGPVFFSQERVGLNGRRFRLFKFRSMYDGTDPYAPSPKTSDDPRITRTGRFLRRKSLDELPQLLNIFRGDMSVVGPRPEMPFIVEKYTPSHRTRLKAKPGLTGVWQISSHRSADIHEVMDYDVYYVENQSFILDMVVVFETAFYFLSGRGGC